MGTLICVRHQLHIPLGSIEPALDASGIEWSYLDVWEGPEFPAIGDLSGLIVLGGEMNADELDSYPFLKQVRDLIADAVAAEIPTMGVCLGAQLLARSLGAAVTRLPVREIGFLKVTATASGAADPVIAPVGDLERVFIWHEDTPALPEGAELLASSAAVVNHAYRVGSAYGIQFHFEVTEKEIATWADNTGAEDLRRVWGTTKAELLRDAARYLPAQMEAARRMTDAFLDQVRRRP